MTDDEWAYFEPFLIRSGGRPPRNHRRVLDAVFWQMRTGAPWRDLPEELGNWNSIFRQFRRWADCGVLDVILEALAGSGACDAALQMVDATIVRAHHCAGGGKGEVALSSDGTYLQASDGANTLEIDFATPVSSTGDICTSCRRMAFGKTMSALASSAVPTVVLWLLLFQRRIVQCCWRSHKPTG